MTQKLVSLGLAALIALAPISAAAGCAVEYKAKREQPFELIYSVAQINGPCTMSNARATLGNRLAQRGITLLKILSVNKT